MSARTAGPSTSTTLSATAGKSPRTLIPPQTGNATAEHIVPRGGASRLAVIPHGCPFNPTLEPSDLRQELAIGRIAQIDVDPALVLDRADRRRGHPQADGTEPVGEQRSALQVGQKATLGLDVGVADIVPDLDTFAGDNTFPRHTAPQSKHARSKWQRGRPRGGRATALL